MLYHNYKTKLKRTAAVLMASIVLVGTSAPVVFAEATEEVKPPVKVIGIYPDSKREYEWFNEETLYHDRRDNRQIRDKLFLKVSFYVEKGELKLAGLDELISNVTVFSDSSNISMVDKDFLNDIAKMGTKEKEEFIADYIFRKDTTNNKNRATLYIPIKPLMSHMTYSVTLNPGIVYDSETKETNDSTTWTFNTMAIPSVSEKDIEVQSVIEDYDETEPIIITGKFFYSPTVEVYFNDVRAYRVRVRKDSEKNDYLEVHLPRGRNRLESGLYDITIENSSNHSKWLYGTLSVVSDAHSKIPEEDNSLGTITPYGVVSGSGLSKVEAIRLDHKEPVKEQLLRKQLTGYTLRSPIVELDGRDSSIYRFTMEIPIDKGEYKKYKVLKYDDFSRRWTEENNYYINNIDQRVNIITFNPGMFVVVEPKK